jgi:hypothetical protein
VTRRVLTVTSVEQDIVSRGCGTRRWDEGVLDFVCCTIVPIRDGKHAEILLVRQRGRAIDLDCTHYSVCVLRGEVAMVLMAFCQYSAFRLEVVILPKSCRIALRGKCRLSMLPEEAGIP